MIKDDKTESPLFKEIQDEVQRTQNKKTFTYWAVTDLEKKPRNWNVEDKQLAEVHSVTAHRENGKLCQSLH